MAQRQGSTAWLAGKRMVKNARHEPPGVRMATFGGELQGLKRNLNFDRLALALALRRAFCVGVSNARSLRTSSRIPSESSLFFNRFRARSIGSPFLTVTSGIFFSLSMEIINIRLTCPRMSGDGKITPQ